MTITVSTTEKCDGKALALFAAWESWQLGKTRDGRPFFAIPGSEAGLFHMADQRDCSCADRQRSRNVCKHMRAVRFWMAAFATGAVAPKPRPGNPEDERVALTPEGAAYLIEQGTRQSSSAASMDADGSRAYLAKLRMQRAARVRLVLAREMDPGDDGDVFQLDEWISRIEARHARQEEERRPKNARSLADLMGND